MQQGGCLDKPFDKLPLEYYALLIDSKQANHPQPPESVGIDSGKLGGE